MKFFPTLAAIGLLFVASASQAADPNLGRNLAATCANCHGTNGRTADVAIIDSLAGTPKSTLQQKLAAFRSGEKYATIMHQIVKGYTDEQLDLIVTYFAAQR